MYNHKPTNPDREEIENTIGKNNIKTLTPEELVETEKQITMNEIEFCLKKTKNNITWVVQVLQVHSIKHSGLP